jgi:hypothetical protein
LVSELEESLSRELWCAPVILALGWQRQEDGEFEASLGYMVRPYLKRKRKGGGGGGGEGGLSGFRERFHNIRLLPTC